VGAKTVFKDISDSSFCTVYLNLRARPIAAIGLLRSCFVTASLKSIDQTSCALLTVTAIFFACANGYKSEKIPERKLQQTAAHTYLLSECLTTRSFACCCSVTTTLMISEAVSSIRVLETQSAISDST
jgi:hypothetical protein